MHSSGSEAAVTGPLTKEAAMKTKGSILTWIATTLLLIAQMTLAAEGQGPGEGMGFWTILFLGFGALIILFQAVPAVVMFATLVASAFKKPALKEAGETDLAESRETTH
jgi:hypothetical protein